MNDLISKSEDDFDAILHIIQAGRTSALQAINTALLETYWTVGQYISQKVSLAQWGRGIVKELAAYIAIQSPDVKGFSAQNLWRMKQFYEMFSADEKLSALPRVLSWTHYCTLMGQCNNTINHKPTERYGASRRFFHRVEAIMSPLVTQIPWTHKLIIFSQTKSPTNERHGASHRFFKTNRYTTIPAASAVPLTIKK